MRPRKTKAAMALPFETVKGIPIGPVLPASATTRRAPKCVPAMHVWSSLGLRLAYAWCHNFLSGLH